MMATISNRFLSIPTAQRHVNPFSAEYSGVAADSY